MNREEVDAKLDATEPSVAARLAELNTTLQAGFAEIARQFTEMRGQMAAMRLEMRDDIHKNTISLLKWGIGIAVAVVGTTVGLLRYLD